MRLNDALLPYQEAALRRRLDRAPRLAASAADLYVAGAGAAARGALALPTPALAPTAPAAVTFLRFGAGALAVGHGVAGVRALFDAAETRADRQRLLLRLRGAADLVTAAGLAGQAFGLGPWTAVVTVAGALAATTASFMSSTEERA